MAVGAGCDWVTGASSGLGQALAKRLAKAGRQVVASARRAEPLQALAEASSDTPGRIHPLPLDVTEPGALKQAVATIEAEIAPIDLAVFNAGTHKPVSAKTLNAADFRSLDEINYLSLVDGLEAVLGPMRERRRGHIALVASLAGYSGLPSSAAYGATKAAVINMAEALKPELDEIGIKLQLVSPGFVKTPLTDKNPFPMPFLMEVEDAAEAFYRGLQSQRFEIIFPRRFAYIMKVLRLLPYPLFFAATRRLVPEEKA